jgi:hypothetical protein
MKKDDKRFSRKFVGVTLGVIAMGAVATVTFHVMKAHSSQPEQKTIVAGTETENLFPPAKNKTSKKPFVNPPLLGKDIPFRSYSFDATKGGSFTYNGSRVTIPGNIFCDDKGRQIKGNVEIKYREFHNPIDFFLSGIPMTYDSGGTQYTFISAGMFDIRGEQDGRQVNIMSGKSMDVQMASNAITGSYNIYVLDTVSKRWVYMDKNCNNSMTLTPVSEASREKKTLTDAEMNSIKAQVEDMDGRRPIAPRLANPENMSFTLNYDKKEFPELEECHNTLFEVDNKSQGFKREFRSMVWDDFTLRRISNSDKFNVTLSHDTNSHSFVVYPVFDPKEYKKAMKEFNENYNNYLTARNKLEEGVTDQVAFNELIAKEEKQAELWSSVAATQSFVIRHFTVSHFGIWNSDCPSMLPVGVSVAANFQDDKKDSLNGLDVYLVDKSRNALFIYHPGHNCQFNPSATNLAWCVTRNNQIAIFTPEDFKKIKVNSGDYTFNLKVVDKEVSSDDDIKSLLDKYL